MAEIKSFPNNADEYVGAEWLMKWFHGRTSGVFGAAGNASVGAVANQMKVSITDGLGWLSNSDSDGIVWWNDHYKNNNTLLTVDVPMASGTAGQNRYDRVIVEWETTNYVAKPQIKIISGSYAETPTPPALTNNNLKRQISLAKVYVASAATTITAADITDERLDNTVCGLVNETISVDTTTINAQFQMFLAAIEEELRDIEGGTAFDFKPVRVTDVSVPTSAFNTYTASGAEETAIYNMGYTYKAQVAVTGVLATMTPYVTWSLPSLNTAGADLLNQYACYAGGIIVYAAGVPSGAIKALTIECRKAVS